MQTVSGVKRVNSRTFLEGFLGLLSAFGPFVMDMYISAFPQITEFYNSAPSVVQLSLTACTVGLALGQLFFGTVSDCYGRRTPLMMSIVLFLLATLGCLASPSIAMFIAMRFFQGLAAAGAVVISRSIVADCYSGSALSSMFGIIGMINGVSTVLAPMFGGFIIGAYGWRAVFWGLAAIGVVMMFGTVCLRESLPSCNRVRLNPSALFTGIRKVVANRLYVGAIVQYGVVMALIFVNLASGPFIMDSYGLSAEQISLVFGANSVALAISSGVASQFKDMRSVIRVASMGMVGASLLLALALMLHLGFFAYEAALFTLYLFVGAVCTTSTALAMESERTNAGIASAFFGAMGYVAGGLASPLVGLGNIFITSSIIFVLLTATSCVLAHKSMKSAG